MLSIFYKEQYDLKGWVKVMKKLLILDLDETLIHSSENEPQKYDFKVGHFFVCKRPYLEKFLIFCNKRFELAIWTSSTEDYAKEIVEAILPLGVEISFLWSRVRCTPTRDYCTGEIGWLKDLKKVKKLGYELSQIIVLDDSPEKLKRNYGNLIRVKPFFCNFEDTELYDLTSYLVTLIDIDNIRAIEKRGWKGQN